MAFLLNIDTAVETASVCLANDDRVLAFAENDLQKDHAAWLHHAISDLLKKGSISRGDIAGIGVSIGPGSYTGLRIGLATAKGLCYALNIPLIAIGTLEMMAAGVRNEGTALVCPLIDARRMEVFTAVYDKTLTAVIKPCAMILDKGSFSSHLASNRIIFTGNGAKKLQTIILPHQNASFDFRMASAIDLAQLVYRNFRGKIFSNVAYAEPLYIKEFYSPTR
jgi:tRNA threonylcarbamoyladenosine biosynthesis protein TsaB